jgi:hypothetical protein
MTITLDELTTAEPKRDRYGRPLIVSKDGGKPKAYTRPTTIADTLDDRYNLELWKQRQVLLGTVARHDLYAKAATTDPTDKKALNKLCEQLMDAAASDAGANMGTAVHAAVEAFNRGLDYPPMFTDDVTAYGNMLLRHDIGVDPDHVEQFVVNDTVGAAGTFDMRLLIDGTWHIADLKTGSTVEWSAKAFAIQLAIYAGHTSTYDWATETHGDPLPVDQSRGIIVHLPAGSGECTLHWLDLDAGREALEHALWVRKWRNRKGLLTPIDGAATAGSESADDVAPSSSAESDGGAGLTTPSAAPSHTLPKPPPVERPDEGGLVTDADYDQLQADGKASAKDVIATMLRWRNEARRTTEDWTTTGGYHTVRRVAISRAALALARFVHRTVGQPDDSDNGIDVTARAVLEEVMDPDDIQSHPVGKLLGLLTPEQATQLKGICDE